MRPLLALWLAGATATRVWDVASVPYPDRDFDDCGLSEAGRICDPNQLLSANARNDINDRLFFIEDNTKHDCGGNEMGYQVGVLVIPMMSAMIGSSTMKMSRAETFSQQIGDKWRIGHSQCNDGIMLFLSKEDRVVYISTAPGAKKGLPNYAIDKIIAAITSKLRADSADLDGALEVGVSMIYDALKHPDKYSRAQDQYKNMRDNMIYYSFIAIGAAIVYYPVTIFLLKCLIYIVAYPFCWVLDKIDEFRRTPEPPQEAEAEEKEGDEALDRIREEMERNDDDEDAGMCSICLENFTAQDEKKNQKVQLPCGHMFHVACIRQWIESRGAGAQCPLCRANIPYDWDAGNGGAVDGKRTRLSATRRLEALLRRLQARYPRWRGGRAGWAPRNAARGLWGEDRCSRGTTWVNYFPRTPIIIPRQRHWRGMLPSMSEAVSQMNRQMVSRNSSNSRSNTRRSGRSFGGGGGFSSRGGGGGGGSW